MTFALKLTHDEPRLVYLALVYHLGRPGSELDPVTKMPVEHGLREVKLALGNALAADEAIIEVDEPRFQRLLSAIKGSITELRGHHMRSGAPSTVERFTDTALTLFPQIEMDPEAALEIAEAMMALARRMERAVARAAAETADRQRSGTEAPARRWRFGRRS